MDNWINNAFQQAQKDAERIDNLVNTIRDFLDYETPLILDQWAKVMGEEKTMKFIAMLGENKELNEYVESLSECFAIAGYLLAKYGYKKQ